MEMRHYIRLVVGTILILMAIINGLWLTVAMLLYFWKVWLTMIVCCIVGMLILNGLDRIESKK